MKILQKITITLIVILTLVVGSVLPLVIVPSDYFTRGLVLAVAGGILGGGLYLARGFYQAVINDQFDFGRFIWWYLLRPLLSGIAGAIAFVIAYLTLDIQETFKNLPAFFLVGVYAGFNFTAFAEGKLKNTL